MKKILFILGFALVFGVNVSAADLNLNTYGTFSNVEVVQKTIYLHKGWNLVQGFAGTDWITTGSNIEEKDIRAIFALNALNKKYVRFHPEPEKEKINDLSAIPHLSYWVYSAKDGTLNYRTAKPETLRYTWPAGWNIISIAPEFVGKSLQDIKGDCAIERIYWWYPRRQEFRDVKENFSDISHSENVGSGLILKFTNECKLSIANSGITPPQLPN